MFIWYKQSVNDIKLIETTSLGTPNIRASCSEISHSADRVPIASDTIMVKFINLDFVVSCINYQY